MEFRQGLRRIRKRYHLTQGQLATLLQCSQSAVATWEKGVCLPRIAVLGTLFEKLPHSAEEFAPSDEREPPLPLPAPEPQPAIITLRRLRTGHNLTRAQLAGLLGVSEKTVANWETFGIPNLGAIQRIQALFRIDVGELR